MIQQPLHFAHYLKPVIWGGDRIAPFKGIITDKSNIGESWEISAVPGHISVVDRGPFAGMSLTQLIETYGAELVGKDIYKRYGSAFPLLIKIIDAKADLSVQVHPDDKLAELRHHSPGKTEMWYIIDTERGARIYSGLNRQITSEEYGRRVGDNSIMDVIASYESAPGQTYFLPAGRIHAIGAGNLLAEIQQTSDITYRIYDYDRRDKDGNPRELHTELAKDAIDYTVYTDYQSHPKGNVLADCQYFDTRLLKLNGQMEAVENPRHSFTIIMCIEGEAEIINASNGERFSIKRGETLLFPAIMDNLAAVSPLATLLTIQS